MSGHQQDQNQNNQGFEVDKKTRVTMPVALYFFLTLFLVGGAMSWYDVRTQVSELRQSQWTRADQELWATKLQAKNPSLNVPGVDSRGNAGIMGSIVNRSP